MVKSLYLITEGVQFSVQHFDSKHSSVELFFTEADMIDSTDTESGIGIRPISAGSAGGDIGGKIGKQSCSKSSLEQHMLTLRNVMFSMHI